jgi:hypothetical protein
MGEKALPDVVFNGHDLNSLSLYQAQNILYIRRGDKDPVYAVGQKYLFRVVYGRFHLVENLAHVHFDNDNRLGGGAFFSYDFRRKRPESLQFQQAEFLAAPAPVFHDVQRAAGG